MNTVEHHIINRYNGVPYGVARTDLHEGLPYYGGPLNEDGTPAVDDVEWYFGHALEAVLNAIWDGEVYAARHGNTEDRLTGK